MESHPPLKSGDIVFVTARNPLYRRMVRASGAKASHVGIVFEDLKAGWMVAESALPVDRYRPLDKFLSHSEDDWFVVRRLRRELSTAEVAALRQACDARMGKWHRPGFKHEARRNSRSKFVYEMYREALGIDVGAVETFSELLRRNPQESPGFWKLWFAGRIPRQRKTLTPGRPAAIGAAAHRVAFR